MKSMIKKDSFAVGLVLGLVAPIVIYGLLRLIYEFMDAVGLFSDLGFADDFRTRTLMLFSICANLFVMQFYRRSHRHHETVRGMLVASMLYVVVWFLKFGFKMLSF